MGAAAAERKKRKRSKGAYIYGNYDHYYGYRVGSSNKSSSGNGVAATAAAVEMEDPRMGYVRREWVQGRDCLDIGCNEGHVTIAVAVKHGSKSMLGVDIDGKLVHKARLNLQAAAAAAAAGTGTKSAAGTGALAGSAGSAAASASAGSAAAAAAETETAGTEAAAAAGAEESTEGASGNISCGAAAAAADKDRGAEIEERSTEDIVVTGEKGLLLAALQDTGAEARLEERIRFRSQNYLESAVQFEAYDTIFCLSVTKWIHLNWGDRGLIKFFAKIFKELRPGGLLVLEPQPWSSYSKKRKVSEVASAHFREAQLRPDDFPALLTEKIGFKSCEEITSELPNDKTGFRRPLFVYRK